MTEEVKSKVLKGKALHAKILSAFRCVVERIIDIEIDDLHVVMLLPPTQMQILGALGNPSRANPLLRANERARIAHQETGLTPTEDSLIRHLCAIELVPYAGGELVVSHRIVTQAPEAS